MGRQLTVNGLYNIYKDYKDVFFPRILEDGTVTDEDKDKIKALLAKPFNPYIRRHNALTEKSVKLKFNTLTNTAFNFHTHFCLCKEYRLITTSM